VSETESDVQEFEALLNYLKKHRAFDFTGYKRTSLKRRVEKRMQSLNYDSFSEYCDHLEVHPDEFEQLFNTILINVTSFFRDPSAWEYLAEKVIPQILERKQGNEPIRVWCAGTASGEEAYTIAILLAEAIGIEQFRERVKIYASDVDEEALTHARSATYTARAVSNVPEELLKKYFYQIDSHFVFHKDLRRSVIFGRHDLIQDAPISRVDLLTCRNTMMYFNAETQSKILFRFHFALNDGGFLFMGKAEMLFTHANLFAPVELRRRIFTKQVRGNLRERMLLMANSTEDEGGVHMTKHLRFREAAFDNSPVAQIVADNNGFLVLANERARQLFNLSPKDLNRPLQDFEFSYRLMELRSCIERVYAERRPISLKETEWSTTSGNIRMLEVQVTPLQESPGDVVGVNIVFNDVTSHKKLQNEIEHANQELETAYEELQSTNEELETTNEELQSTVEELETTNEELQSTNEELETMNEELQSTNEELQTINEELRRRTEELHGANAFLDVIMTSLGSGVVVIDSEFNIKVWNAQCEEMWGLKREEVAGRNFLGLDIGLPVEHLRAPIRGALGRETGNTELMMDARNRRGKPICCKISCTPLMSKNNDNIGVILMMDELDTI
jgi:two-component system CheB/CheR fusion protein